MVELLLKDGSRSSPRALSVLAHRAFSSLLGAHASGSRASRGGCGAPPARLMRSLWDSARVAVVDPSEFHLRGGEVRGLLQVEDDEVDKGLERVPVLDDRWVPERAEEALAEASLRSVEGTQYQSSGFGGQ